MSLGVYNNILELIGNTPMVKINRLNPNPDVTILAKLEQFNPTGSIKDRIALQMIESAETEGSLVEGKTILEATSGNTGIGLAFVGRLKGYSVKIVMSEAVSIERRKIIQGYGAEVILSPAQEGTDGAIRLAREIAKKSPDKYYTPDQFSNKNNILTHCKYTADEIWKQTEGKIDYVVSALGTSGTIMGLCCNLKEKDPSIKIVEAHPIKGHYIQGLKNMEEALVPSIYQPERIDESIMVESEEAIDMAKRIIANEGIFAGMSSGAALIAARAIAEKIDSGTIVVIFPDGAEKYLSTSMFNN